MTPNNLDLIREEIDAIDSEILALFKRRMACAQKVAEIKADTGQPIFHPDREREILERVGRQGEHDGAAAQILFANIMDLSRARQQEILGGGETLRQLLAGAKTDLSLAPSQAVACPGVPGSFSGEAARQLFPAAKRAFYPQFADVFAALAQGECPVGVLPAENSSAGPVDEVYTLLLEHGFYIIRTSEVSISHCLCAVKGARAADIRTAYSHPQALAQCSEWIEKHGLNAVKYSNTAAAAQMIAEKRDLSCAVICSRRAAEQYGLEILERDIQNERDNRTRFIAVSRSLIILEGADRISVCFSLPHVTGSLYRVLQRFALHGLNLTRIESCPIPDKPFAYRFFVDFAGDVREGRTVNLLCALYEELPSFVFLGAARAVSDGLTTA